MPEPDAPIVSVVIPCFNEEAVLPELIRRVGASCRRVAGEAYEIILVNDGSRDRTWRLIRTAAEGDRHVVGIDLSRNFGHQMALSAGLEMARGDRILVLDADLQDPPEALGEMMRLIDGGADVVYGQRIRRDGETWFKKRTASLFYGLLSKLAKVEIPSETGDFRLMTRKVVDALLRMNEQHRFIRGMIAWLGFRQVPYAYRRQGRAAGRTHYSLGMMVRLALDGITGFSVAPLRLGIHFGLLIAGGGVVSTGYAFLSWMLFDAVPGWSSTVILMSVFSSVQLLTLGVIGEYIGRMFLEVKRRPLFVINEIAVGARESAGAALQARPEPSDRAPAALAVEAQA